jgi:hypothetical protein
MKSMKRMNGQYMLNKQWLEKVHDTLINKKKMHFFDEIDYQSK